MIKALSPPPTKTIYTHSPKERERKARVIVFSITLNIAHSVYKTGRRKRRESNNNNKMCTNIKNLVLL